METNNTSGQNDSVKPINLTIIVSIVIGILVVLGVFSLPSNKKDVPSPETRVNLVEESTSSATQPSEPSAYSMEDVQAHNLETDCWMAIEGKVYNVTDFVGKHPGGKAIINGCGKDATVLFNERPTNDKGPHPANARTILEGFYIGNLKL